MRFINTDISRKHAIECVDALSGLLLANGTFVYRHIIGLPKPRDDFYNSIRHIFCVWYLLEAELALGPLDGVRERAILATSPITDQYLVPFAGERTLAVLNEGFVKVGVSGLAIAVLCRMWDVTSDGTYLNLANQVGEFVLGQQQASGDFVQVRQYPLGVAHPHRDHLSAGQAIVGLLYLYERTKEQSLLDSARRAVTFLDEVNHGVQIPSHWMLYALGNLYRADPKPAIISYADRIAGTVLHSPEYRKQGLSTPIACATEGLLAYLALLERANPETRHPLHSEAMRAARQNLSLLLKYRRNGGLYVEGDNKPEIRIDYIAHAGLCFMAYALLTGKAATRQPTK